MLFVSHSRRFLFCRLCTFIGPPSLPLVQYFLFLLLLFSSVVFPLLVSFFHLFRALVQCKLSKYGMSRCLKPTYSYPMYVPSLQSRFLRILLYSCECEWLVYSQKHTSFTWNRKKIWEISINIIRYQVK